MLTPQPREIKKSSPLNCTSCRLPDQNFQGCQSLLVCESQFASCIKIGRSTDSEALEMQIVRSVLGTAEESWTSALIIYGNRAARY